MDEETRAVLYALGWKSYDGFDGKGEPYTAWYREQAYFHVYLERCPGGEVRLPRVIDRLRTLFQKNPLVYALFMLKRLVGA